MEARQRIAPATVTEVVDLGGLAALAPEWNDLVEATSRELFYRAEFIRTWLENFAGGAALRVLTLRSPEGALEAVLPLIAERVSMYGLPVRQLSAAANAHSCRFDLVAREPAAAAAAFLTHLQADSSWDLLRILDVPDGGAAYALLEHARRERAPTGTWDSLLSPYIALPQRHADFEARLPAKFKANCRRRRKKLEEKGTVTFERFTGGPELGARLEEGFALEQSGWKGQRGTAMAQDARTRGFYTQLARESAEAGRLTLHFLRLDGRAVAFHFGLSFQGRYLLLKPGYDEALRECSPGQLLVQEVVRDLIGRGVTEFDFLGPDMVWKRDWTDLARQHRWLFLFRSSAFGRALRAAKFKWAPLAKDVVKRWKR